MSEHKLCPIRALAGFSNFYAVCIRETCAWWVKEETGRSSIHIGETGVNETPLDDIPGHCAMLDIGRAR